MISVQNGSCCSFLPASVRLFVLSRWGRCGGGVGGGWQQSEIQKWKIMYVGWCNERHCPLQHNPALIYAIFLLVSMFQVVRYVGIRYQFWGGYSSRYLVAKYLTVFVFRFANEPCAGNSGKNGTCYTEAECTNKDGAVAGTCAEGYGICCVCKQNEPLYSRWSMTVGFYLQSTGIVALWLLRTWHTSPLRVKRVAHAVSKSASVKLMCARWLSNYFYPKKLIWNLTG